MLIEIYTDGSATVKSKPGGYGWVLVIDGVKHSEGNGHILLATNNDAEMAGAIYGMAAVVRFLMSNPDLKPEVHLRSDSKIVLNWADGSSQFKQKGKEHTYVQLRSLFLRLNAKCRWVKGHSGHEHNERCDKLASLGRHGLGPDQVVPKIVKKDKIGTRTENIICLIYKNGLKLVDLENNLVENYNPTLHGERTATTTQIELRIKDTE